MEHVESNSVYIRQSAVPQAVTYTLKSKSSSHCPNSRPVTLRQHDISFMLEAITTNSTTGNTSDPLTMLPKTFPCNTCNYFFEDSQAQRAHMRDPWHIYNLKRRISSLPPISAIIYKENVATSLVSTKQEPHRAELLSKTENPSGERDKIDVDKQEEVRDLNHINCCLFCTWSSDTLESNVEHMTSDHGLYIPDIQDLTSLGTFIEYLRTVIDEYSECLYCGTIKQSGEGVRRHMLDKGHCMINLEREPELLEFWDFSDSDEEYPDDEQAVNPRSRRTEVMALKNSSQDECILPSGRIIGSKTRARESRLFARRAALVIKNNSNQRVAGNAEEIPHTTSPTTAVSTMTGPQRKPQDYTVAARDAVGLVGVSDQQIRSLVNVRRKMQRQEAVVRASASWADELGGTHQKHYKQKMNLRDG